MAGNRYEIADDRGGGTTTQASPPTEAGIPAAYQAKGTVVDRRGWLYDPRTGAALTRHGWVAVRSGSSRARELTPEEKTRTHSLVEVDLPFRLERFEGLWSYDNGVELAFGSIARPLRHAAYHLGFPETVGPAQGRTQEFPLSLEPDDHGLAGFTRVLAVIPRYLPVPARAEHATLLNYLARMINQVVTFHSLATGQHGTRSLAADDFLRYEFRHLLLPERVVCNAHAFYFPSKPRPRIEAPARGDEAVFAEVTRLSRLDECFRSAYGLLAEAQRALRANEPRLAAILAGSAVESALRHAIEQALLANPTRKVTIPSPDGRTPPRVLMGRTFDKLDPRLSLAEALHDGLRQILPLGVAYPTATVEGCDRLRAKQVQALHQTASFDRVGMESAVESARHLLDFLVEIGPRPPRG